MSNPIIGYTLGAVFDRTTSRKPDPVTSLTAEQQAMKNEIEDTKEIVRKAKKRLDELMHGCTHPVFRDEPGFEYNGRICTICRTCIEMV
jgi:hypothetical protein